MYAAEETSHISPSNFLLKWVMPHSTANSQLVKKNSVQLGMRAQASLDTLITMGVGLIFAAAFFSMALGLINDSIVSSQGHSAVESISAEINYVHSSGEGTIRYIDVTIPNGVSEIRLDGNRVYMKVARLDGYTDFFSDSPTKLVGSISTNPGPQRITIRYLPSGNIQVGEMKLAASPKLFAYSFQRSQGNSSQVMITNNADFTITGISATQEGLSDLMTITSPSATIAPSATTNMTLTISVPPTKPSGTYSGYIHINSTNGGWDDVLVSITVTDGIATNCSLSPVSANLTLGQTRAFTSTCFDASNNSVSCPLLIWSTNAGSVIPSVSYSSTTLIGTNVNGSYLAADSGFSCNASISVINGPTVTALFISPTLPMMNESITVNATVDATLSGGMNISMCLLKIDSGLWQDMNPTDGAFDSVFENATKVIGTLAKGTHAASVKCNDSGGNFGSEFTTSFYVRSNDTIGPIVTALFITPTSPIAGQSITVNATGNDSTTGGANISLCQLSIDSGTWQNLNANDGAYNAVAELVSLGIGPKSVGRHNASVRCNDSEGNMGNSSTINFTVSPKNILFITNGAAASTAEQQWLTWISTHSSGLGMNWSYETAQDSAVVAGTTNATDYKIVVMAEYDNALSGLNTSLNNYKTAGGIIVMLGSSIQYGPRYLGYTTANGISNNAKWVYVTNNTHYITGVFALDWLTVNEISTATWRSTDNLGGVMLADFDVGDNDPLICSANRLVTWGFTRPDRFTADGNTITTRILDYCLNASTIGS